ncbi:sigma factor-like helix-turn-helix DNA-binding protein [Brachyspira sp. G79]|uniref:sigma factor-like helix-turn-helix DNA-binding protein n=1 Tax=Brachyspira sp. G79 TaxID=1358104 RepID=UPI0032046605
MLYYYYDLTLKEIAKILEVSDSRIIQLHTKDIKGIYNNSNISYPKLSRNIEPQEMTDISIIPISQYNETMKRYIETSTTYLSDVWYVDDDYDEISVIDTLKSKTNQEYFNDREYAKNKIISDLKKMPEKVTKAVIIIIQR